MQEQIIEHYSGIRYRVKIAYTSKGLPSFDCSIETHNLDVNEALRLSDELVAKLKERYPVGEELA